MANPTPNRPPLQRRSAMKVTSGPCPTAVETARPSSPESPQAHRHSLPVTRPPPLPRVSSPPLSSSTSFGQSSTLSSSTSTPSNPALFSPSPSIQGYTPKVSFDTFENPAASMFSFTLGVKSDGYVRTRSTRVFLCASSADESGREALDWALEALVQDGDELIVCRGVDQEELGKFNVFITVYPAFSYAGM